MASESQVLGILKPIGGGDPIPLKKPELVIGRRPSCDIRLDYENISGKHCQLSYGDGVWHVKDLGSTNGTTLNGSKFQGQESLMPDDELGIARHLFRIDYDPAVPVAQANQMLKQELGEDEEAAPAPRASLMELAGLSRGEDRPAPPRPGPGPGPGSGSTPPRKARPIEPAEPPTATDPVDPVFSGPNRAPAPPKPKTDGPSESDFFDMIQADVESESKKKKRP